jgi:hypothetical protein
MSQSFGGSGSYHQFFMTRFAKILLVNLAIWAVGVLAIFLAPLPIYPVRGFASLLSVPISLALFMLSVIALVREQKKTQIPVLLLLVFASLLSFSRRADVGEPLRIST